MKVKIICGMAIVGLVVGIGVILAINKQFIQGVEKEVNRQESAYYLTCNHDENTFCTHLPIVIIDTEEQGEIQEEAMWVQIGIIDHEGRKHLNDQKKHETLSTIHIRGSSSRHFDKKQYRLEFYEGEKGNKRNDLAIMGMGKDSDWVLNGPYLDKTLLRNHLMYDLSREILDWAPDTRFCEVFVNGQYQGLYLMVERVKMSEERIRLNDYGLLSGQTPYILSRARINLEDEKLLGETNTNLIKTYGALTGNTAYPLMIEYPSVKNITLRQKRWITEDINKFEEVLYSDYFMDENRGYRQYIDVDNFVDYYIINEFAMILDASQFSTYIYKDIEGKFKMTTWDFNNAFNHYAVRTSEETFYVVNNNWFNRLLQDRVFVDQVIERYKVLRKSILGEEHLIKKIDETIQYLGEAIERNNKVWAVSFQKKMFIKDDGPSREIHNYEQAIRQLKESIIARGRYLDEHMEQVYKDRETIGVR